MKPDLAIMGRRISRRLFRFSCVIGKLVQLLVGNCTGEIHFTEKEEKNVFFFFPDELMTFTPHTYPF